MIILLLLSALTVSSSELLEMSLKNYTLTKKENYPIAVLFYGADRQSKRFKEEFEQIALGDHELLNKAHLSSDLKFGIVNAVQEKILMERTQISDLPNLYLFISEDQKIKFNGVWNAQSLINWIKKAFRETTQLNKYHPSSLVTTFKQLQTKFEMFKLVAILITPDYRLTPLKYFTETAKQLTEGYVFCHIHDSELSKILGVGREVSQLIVYSRTEDVEILEEESRKKWRTFMHYFPKDVTTDNMLPFMQLFTWRGWFYVDDVKLQKLQKRQDMLPTVIMLYNRTDGSHSEAVERMKNARYQLFRKAALGIMDVNGDARARVEKFFGIDATIDLPRLFAIKPTSNQLFFKYIDSTQDPIEFYQNILNQKTQPFYKDQGLIEESKLYDGAGVMKLTRTTYQATIDKLNQEGKDLVITYGAIICEPCQIFKPDYHTAAKFIRRVNQIVFAKVDLEFNELDDVQIDSYPHVMMYKAGMSKPIVFYADNKNDVELINWVKLNSNWGHLVQEQDL